MTPAKTKIVLRKNGKISNFRSHIGSTKNPKKMAKHPGK